MGAVKGIEVVIKELRGYGKEIERILEQETKEAAQDIEGDAIINAPKDNGYLHSKIRHYKKANASYGVAVNVPYGAYLEFGTGTKVKVPTEMKEIAESFRGKQKGTYEQGLESIEIWCKRKGIPKEVAKLIFWKILKVGMNPQPYLYPAFLKGKKNYLTKLNIVLDKFNKKI